MEFRRVDNFGSVAYPLVVKNLVAMLTLLIWGACSLHCSVEAHEVWPDGSIGAVCISTHSCPGDHAPDEIPDSQCQDAFFTLSGKSIQLEAPTPIDPDADSFLRLAGRLIEEFDRNAFVPSDSLSHSEANLVHKFRDQSSGRVAAPIRGPSA